MTAVFKQRIKDFSEETDFPYQEIERDDDDEESVEIMSGLEQKKCIRINDGSIQAKN